MKIAAATFDAFCAAFGIPAAQAEYVFAPPRRWRFDYCWTKYKVALEIQGGLFSHGRHTRGAALLKEHEKLNAAACKGWRILYCIPKDVQNGSVFSLIKKALEAK